MSLRQQTPLPCHRLVTTAAKTRHLELSNKLKRIFSYFVNKVACCSFQIPFLNFAVEDELVIYSAYILDFQLHRPIRGEMIRTGPEKVQFSMCVIRQLDLLLYSFVRYHSITNCLLTGKGGILNWLQRPLTTYTDPSKIFVYTEVQKFFLNIKNI